MSGAARQGRGQRVPLREAADRVLRARRVGLTFGRVYFGIKANQFIARRLRPPDMGERWSSFHRSTAAS